MQVTADYDAQWLNQQKNKKLLIELLQADGASKNVADYWERSVRLFNDQKFIQSANSDVALTYNEANSIANKIAQWSLQLIGDKNNQTLRTICFMSKNSVLYPCVQFGLAKVGWTVSLVNYNLKGALLIHALEISQAVACVVEQSSLLVFLECYKLAGREPPQYFVLHGDFAIQDRNQLDCFSQDFDGIKQLDYWNHDYDPGLTFQQYRQHVSDRDPYLYIFTSGTTGASKAAKFSHKRWIGCGVTWTLPSDAQLGTSYYIPLPLYHGNGGAIAMSTVVLNGMQAIVREKFSTSNFWTDIQKYNCRTMIHVGELWRYLCNLPAQSVPSTSPLKVVVGNGLRPAVWHQLYEFGVERVVEHYGSTEMPGDAVLQWFNKLGSCGYVSPAHRHLHSGLIIKYDTELKQPNRDEHGRCIQVGVNEVGELVMPLDDGTYDGYVNADQTSKKLYRSVQKQQDTWFSTGDLLRVDQDGFYYFVDRMGDTFRWKGENVATSEIESVLAKFPGLLEANVYGVVVQGSEGKAGMLLIQSIDNAPIDIQQLSKFVTEQLPSYAIPVFVRMHREEAEKTSTFKYQKALYVKQGYDPTNLLDAVYFWNRANGQYEPLTAAVYQEINTGKIKL